MFQAEGTEVAKARYEESTWWGCGWLDFPDGHMLCSLTHSFMLNPLQGFCKNVPAIITVDVCLKFHAIVLSWNILFPELHVAGSLTF